MKKKSEPVIATSEKKSNPEAGQNPQVDESTTTNPASIEESEPDLDKIRELVDLVYKEREISNLKQQFKKHILKIISRHPVSKKYLLLFLYDENNGINEKMTDKIYNAIPPNNDKPILLVLHSKGGEIEPAYLISKACVEKSPNFIVVIPRRAKSAATLISLGASEIHMGSMSELGPIDPQFGNLPALGLSSSLESIAKIVSKYPKSSDMFAKYLSDKLNLSLLGYFERVSESAKQYAQRLLEGKSTPKDIADISHALVYEYKDHSFVIDKDEAKKYLGDVIKINSEEYKFANDIHKFMSNLNWVAGLFKDKNLEIIGNYNGFSVTDIKDKN